MRGLALVAVLASACKPSAPPTRAPPDATMPAPPVVDLELMAVADRLDPGPQAPLYVVLPTWLKDKVTAELGPDPAATATIAAAREAIEGWDKLEAAEGPAAVRAAVQLGRGLVLAEHAVAAGSSDPELLAALTRAYRLVRQLEALQKTGLAGQMTQMALDFARREGRLEARQIEEAMAALKLAVARAPALQLHMTARLLREHPGHPTVPEALVRASQVEVEAERFVEAARLRALAVRRKGDRATGADHLGLAEVCYRGLDLAGGDLAKKSAEKSGRAALGERLAEVERAAARAREILALASATALEPVNERAVLLLKLGRHADAQALFTALRAAHPDDARPLTGLALLAIARDLDFKAAATQIRAGRGLGGRDRLYYEIGLGTVPMLVLSELGVGMAKVSEAARADIEAWFAELQAMAVEFAAFEPARAAVLQLMFAAARETVLHVRDGEREAAFAGLRELPARALALTRRFPDSRDAWRLLLSTVRFVADPAQARRLVLTPLPPALREDADLRLQQARALLDIALLFEDRRVLAAAAEAAASLPAAIDADTAATIAATIAAVQGSHGDARALQRALDGFARLAGGASGTALALAYNNAAMVLAIAGDREQALSLLERAASADPAQMTPPYNAFALGFELGAREGLTAQFAAVVSRATIAAVRLHARAWLVALADAHHGDIQVTREEFAAALAKERRDDLHARLPLGRWGVAERSAFNVSLGYSLREGLTLVDEVVPQWWLFAPAPTFDALVAPKRPARPRSR